MERERAKKRGREREREGVCEREGTGETEGARERERDLVGDEDVVEVHLCHLATIRSQDFSELPCKLRELKQAI